MSRGASASLARATLIRMGIRVAIVVVLATGGAYVHMFATLRGRALAELQTYVTERGHREQLIFSLAQDNHAVLVRALEERIRGYRGIDPRGRFDALYARWPDGTVRNRWEGWDGTRMAGVFVGRDTPVDADVRRRVLAAADVVSQFGPAFHARFQDTYVTTPDNIGVIYWPEYPTWCQDAAADFVFGNEEYVWVADRFHDPQRRTVWTGLFFDKVARRWMASVETPLDVDGRHVATVGHDVMLDELMQRTLNEHLAGGFNVILRDDGRLIAHPERMREIQDRGGRFEVLVDGDEHLRATFELVRHRPPGQVVLEDVRHDEYVAVAELDGPGWYLLTILPRSVVTGPAWETARVVLVLGLLSLLVELVVLSVVLRRQVRRPLVALIGAVDRLAAGDDDLPLDTTRRDELGRLARAFRAMGVEVRNRERALRSSQRLLQSIIDTSTALIYVKDLAGRYLLVNRRFAQLRGKAEAEIVGRTDHDFLSREAADRYRANDLRALEAGTAIELEETAPIADGSRSYISIKSPLRDADGAVFATCGISTDITERKRAEEDRARLYEAAEDANRLKDEFLATLSHELRTPLHAIMGWVQALRRDLLDATTTTAAFEAIERNARAQTQLVADLLDVSRIVSGKLCLELRPVAVAPIVEAALDTVRPTAVVKGLEVRVMLDRTVGPVSADPDRLQQVIWNVLSNAIKFTPKGGRIEVELARVGAEAEIVVRDTGEGIQPDFLPHLFERFRQGNGSDTRVHGGLGLGLAIVRHLVELHGGTVRGSSEGEGRGATFTIRLPLAAAERHAPSEIAC
ncbi:MAG: ATP-binding protein [Candidatus Binatia bacterium]